MSVMGFDFGTTNSLASVVVGDSVITFLDNEQPIPSVVSFEGGKVEVGRKAHDKLTSAGLGVQGSTVRSPKTLLGRDELIIDGGSHHLGNDLAREAAVTTGIAKRGNLVNIYTELSHIRIEKGIFAPYF